MFFKSMRFVIASIVAVCADFIQLVLFPFFGEGFLSPLNDILDFAVAGIMMSLLGFHWVFLPSLAGEMVPGLNLMPLWTGAVFVAGMGQHFTQQQPPQGQTVAMVPQYYAHPMQVSGSGAPQQILPASAPVPPADNRPR